MKWPEVKCNQKTKYFILVVCMYFIYMYIYSDIAPLFEYLYKFKCKFDYLRFFISFPYVLIIARFSRKQLFKNKISSLFLVPLGLLYFLPGIAMYSFSSFNNTYFLFHFLSYISLCSADVLIPSLKKEKNLVKLSNERIYTVLGYGISLLTMAIVIVYNGFHITLNLNDVYSLRNQWSSSSMPNIFNYYIPFAARITPILTIIALYKRNYVLATTLILSQLISFSFGGMKYTLFAMIIVLCISKTVKNKNRSILFVLISGILSLSLIDNIFGNSLISIYFIRRTCFIPNQIAYYYFNFAQTHDYLYFSESFLRHVYEYPYNMTMPHIIGGYAFNKPSMGANTGLMAEGFSQIGWMSLIIYPTLYVIVFRIFEYCSYNMDTNIAIIINISAVILYSMTFIDGAFFSVLLTQGFIGICIVLFILSRNIELYDITHSKRF